MSDQNQTTDTSFNPATGSSPFDQSGTTTPIGISDTPQTLPPQPTIPTMPGDADMPTPPTSFEPPPSPQAESVQDINVATSSPTTSSGDAPPPEKTPSSPGDSGDNNIGIPPVVGAVPPSKKPKKKVIATLLGFLLLVGGIGAGVILVQQQQDIRERAATGTCMGTTYVTDEYSECKFEGGIGYWCEITTEEVGYSCKWVKPPGGGSDMCGAFVTRRYAASCNIPPDGSTCSETWSTTDEYFQDTGCWVDDGGTPPTPAPTPTPPPSEPTPPPAPPGVCSEWSNPVHESVLPGSGNMQTHSQFIIGNTLWQAIWRNDQGWMRTVPIVNNQPNWSGASSWDGPTPLSAVGISGLTSIQTHSEFVIGTKLWQVVWGAVGGSSQGYMRTVPIVNNQPQWGSATTWDGPFSLGDINIPGMTSIYTQSEFVAGNNLWQAVWGNINGMHGYFRKVPISGNEPQWGSAGAWQGPVGLLPGSGTIQTHSDFVIGITLWQTIWRSNEGYLRTVPIINGEPDWEDCPAPSPPSPPPMPGPPQCLQIKAYDEAWQTKDLESIKVGDTVRFAIEPSHQDPNIKGATFTFNNSDRAGIKRANTNEYYIEVTITQQQNTVHAKFYF